MANMIRNWREDWGQGQFPFLFVQLAPYAPSTSTSWAVLRESQWVTSLKVPNTAMAVITDVGDPKNIHPTRKEPVGARLALAARAIAYGEKVGYRGPLYKSVSFDGNRAIVEFDTSGLVAKDGDLKGFAVAGKAIFSPPEILYPAWMTAILHSGTGPDASTMSLAFNPWGRPQTHG
jgi:sialate O-acetylesterase